MLPWKRCSVSLVVLFVVLLLETTTIAVPSPMSSTDSIFHRKHIIVYNYLPNDARFDIHCMSGDNDLGLQHIDAKGIYTFSFKPRIDGSTLFYCGVGWIGARGNLRFNIYDYQRDYDRCDHNCVWDVRSDAVVGFRENDENPDIVLPWPKP